MGDFAKEPVWPFMHYSKHVWLLQCIIALELNASGVLFPMRVSLVKNVLCHCVYFPCMNVYLDFNYVNHASKFCVSCGLSVS